MTQELRQAEILFLPFRRYINDIAGLKRHPAEDLDAQPWQGALAIAPVLAGDDFDPAQILHPMERFRVTHHSIDVAVIAQLFLGVADIDVRAGVTYRVITGLDRRPRQQRAERESHHQEKHEQAHYANKYPSLLQSHRRASRNVSTGSVIIVQPLQPDALRSSQAVPNARAAG